MSCVFLNTKRICVIEICCFDVKLNSFNFQVLFCVLSASTYLWVELMSSLMKKIITNYPKVVNPNQCLNLIIQVFIFIICINMFNMLPPKVGLVVHLTIITTLKGSKCPATQTFWF